LSSIAIAAVLAATILLASTISVELGLSVALIELFAGVVVGNAFHVSVPDWLNFVGSFAGIVLTFLAGAEVDVPQFKREWKASLTLGLVSFGAPFVVVGLLAYYGLGWNHRQAEIAGIALSTTSLAVVYAVLVEAGLNQTTIGKRLMAATFVTDLGPAGVRHWLDDERALRQAPQGAGADARRRVRLSDPVLLPQGRSERLGRGAVGEPGRARRVVRREDGAEVRRHLPARPPLHRAARDLHDAADEHGA
jgi:hypothetical protein